MRKGLSEEEYNHQRKILEEALDVLSKSEVDIEDILKSNHLQWDQLHADPTYMALLEVKAKELYDTLWHDPLNGIQRYFPYRFDTFNEPSRLWWLSLVNRCQIIRPLNTKDD